MRLAPFPAVSPWARRRLTPADLAEIEAAEPRDARVSAVVEPRGVFVSVTITSPKGQGSGTARSPIEAFRKARATFGVTLPPVEIVSVLRG